MARGYIKVHRVRQEVRGHGKRTGKGFLEALDRHVAELVSQACEVHNGSRSTLDATVLDYITGRLK